MARRPFQSNGQRPYTESKTAFEQFQSSTTDDHMELGMKAGNTCSSNITDFFHSTSKASPKPTDRQCLWGKLQTGHEGLRSWSYSTIPMASKAPLTLQNSYELYNSTLSRLSYQLNSLAYNAYSTNVDWIRTLSFFSQLQSRRGKPCS